jgi:hypothetical protein
MSETLRYITLHEDELQGYLIVIQLSGGGAAAKIKRGASSAEVISTLYRLAHTIKQTVEERESNE